MSIRQGDILVAGYVPLDSYDGLRDKPSINGVVLEGNKTLDEIGVPPLDDYVNFTELNTTLEDYLTVPKLMTILDPLLETYVTTNTDQIIENKKSFKNGITLDTQLYAPGRLSYISFRSSTTEDESNYTETACIINENTSLLLLAGKSDSLNTSAALQLVTNDDQRLYILSNPTYLEESVSSMDYIASTKWVMNVVNNKDYLPAQSEQTYGQYLQSDANGAKWTTVAVVRDWEE